MGANTPYQQFAYAGDWSLSELTSTTTRDGLDLIAVTSTAQTASQSFDGYLSANNPHGTQGMMATWSNDNTGWIASDGVFVPYDEANRGPIAALANYYIAANPNTYFLYNALGWSYFETDEYYYWASPTTTTSAISVVTTDATVQITASDITAFANLSLYNQVVVKLGTTGEVIMATKVNNTTLSTTGPIHYSYPAGTTISYAAMGHQATDTLPALSNIWKWGPWFPAISVNVGAPDPSGYNGGVRNLAWISGPASSGNSSACGNNCSPVWRRDYTNAIVLSRVATDATPSSEYVTYSVPISLGGTYYPLQSNGTTGAGVTSIQLRGSEAAILMKAPVN